MSTGVAGDQAIVGFDFDVTQISKRMEEGYRITTVAGDDDSGFVSCRVDQGALVGGVGGEQLDEPEGRPMDWVPVWAVREALF